MVWRAEDPEGNEAAKIKYEIVKYTRGDVLDLGCGPWKAFPHFISVDTGAEWGVNWSTDIRRDAVDLSIFASQSMDAVFSSHLLEHIENTEAALMEWWRVIKNGGHLVLYLPHKNFYPNMGSKHANPYHKHDFRPLDIIAMMKRIGYWDLVENQERNQDNEYSFFQVYKKITKPEHEFSWATPKPEKTCAVVRYGGIGDMIQTSSVLPELKKLGFHITCYVTPVGYEILKNDPNVDDFYLQDNDQVPNLELGPFWEVHEKKYDRFINLCESVEGTFLALPERLNHRWPLSVRKKYLDANYLEFIHDLAGVPYHYQQKFYPTNKEKRWAERQRKGIDGTVVLWCLSGSSVHKVWPYMDSAIARMLLDSNKDFRIVTVGDAQHDPMLEGGWQEEPRVITRAGKWTIRESLSFARCADIIVGPETGIVNSVAFDKMPKIVFLSHSSKNNLTRDWVNTETLIPEGCSCYPCHRLHYGFEHCNKHENGTSDCQTKIDIEDFWSSFKKVI